MMSSRAKLILLTLFSITRFALAGGEALVNYPQNGHKTFPLAEGDLVPQIEMILNALASEGYPLAAIDSVRLGGDGSSEVKVFVSCGLPLLIKDSDRETGNLRGAVRAELISKVEAILDSLNDAGYPFASVTVKPNDISLSPQQITASIGFTTIPGPFCRIGEVAFCNTANQTVTTTLDGSTTKLLTLTAGIRPGSPFSKNAIEQGSRRLEQSNRVLTTGEPFVAPSSTGWVSVTYPVEPRPSLQFEGALTASSGDTHPRGDLQLQINGFAGASREVKFTWFGINPDITETDIRYTEGWIAGQPIDVGLHLTQVAAMGGYSSTEYGLSASWRPYSWLLKVGGAYQHQASPSSSTRWIEGEVARTQLDDDWNPTYGYSWKFRESYGLRKAATHASRQINRHFASAETALPLGRWLTGLLMIAQESIDGSIANEERVQVGGSRLRGYRAGEVVGKGVAAGTLELRHSFGRKIGFGGVFVDGAYIFNKAGTIRGAPTRFASFGVFTSYAATAGSRVMIDLGFVPGRSFREGRLNVKYTGWM